KSQYVAAEGEIEHDMSFSKDGTGNLSLQAALQLRFKLRLSKGSMATTNENPLVIYESCRVESDSLYGGYGSGTMTKKGLQDESFLFPVGYGGNNRWLRLYEVAGDVTVRFARGDPSIISPQTGDGLHHISKLEYWHLLTDQMLSLGSVRLSFHDPQSGGVTN